MRVKGAAVSPAGEQGWEEQKTSMAGGESARID